MKRRIAQKWVKKLKEYEFKSKHLRIYVMKVKHGKLVVLGGTKNAQKKEIKRFRSIKKDYKEAML